MVKLMFSICQWVKCPHVSSCLCSVNGFVGSAGGSSLGKIIPPKSAPPPLPPPGNSRKTDLRVVVPQAKGMIQTLVRHGHSSCLVLTGSVRGVNSSVLGKSDKFFNPVGAVWPTVSMLV